MNNDSIFMHRCLALAYLGAGHVAPNPMVGAVLVYQNKIIGEGYHQQYGQSHAEVNCIKDAEKQYNMKRLTSLNSLPAMLQNSAVYVSLEPCVHFGKTPPCADLLIEKKISKVVIGCRDPFRQVDGRGIEKLLAAGVEVKTDILEEECKELNKRFFTFHIKHRPYIILKWAQSANGKIANNDRSKAFISNEITNRRVHKWRSEEASILIGTTTAVTDDPSLTTRLWVGNNPVRLVIDFNLRLPASLQVFNSAAKTIIFNTLKQGEQQSLFYYRVNSDQPLGHQIAQALYELNIQSVIVEGGAKLIQGFIDERLWDEARIITNNEMQIRNGIDAPLLSPAILTESQNVCSDIIRFYKPVS